MRRIGVSVLCAARSEAYNVPGIDGELAGDQARAGVDAVAEDFKHATATSDWLSR
jgi:hypothetical protein